MSDVRPPLFDDGGGLPDTTSSTTTSPGTSVRTPSPGRSGQPNYAVRRGIVVAVAVATVATAAVVAGRMIGSSDDGDAPAAVTTEWDTVVLTDPSTGEVVLFDADGEERERIASGVRSVDDVDLAGNTLLVDAGDQVSVVDLGGEKTIAVEFAERDTGLVHRPAGTAATMVVGSADRAVLVHGPSGDVIDTAELPVVTGTEYELDRTLADVSGRHVLVADTGNFQSVLFSFGRDEPAYFPGLPLAVDGERIATAQNVGNEATISIFRHDEDPVSAARTAQVRTAMFADGALIVASVDGQLLAVDTDSGDTADGDRIRGEVTVVDGAPSVGGRRLAVVDSDGVTIVDETGQVVTTVDGAELVGDGPPLEPTCLGVDRAAAGDVVLVSWDDGSIVAETLADSPPLLTPDGCTAAVHSDDGVTLLTVDGVTTHDIDGELVAITPDGASVVVEQDRRLVLQPLADDGDPVDLGRAGRLVAFTDR